MIFGAWTPHYDEEENLDSLCLFFLRSLSSQRDRKMTETFKNAPGRVGFGMMRANTGLKGIGVLQLRV